MSANCASMLYVWEVLVDVLGKPLDFRRSSDTTCYGEWLSCSMNSGQDSCISFSMDAKSP